MKQTSKRIVAGPLERMLLENLDIYPNDATADLSIEQLDDFRKQRAAGRWREYPVLAVQVEGHAGRLFLKMVRPMLAQVMGTTGGVTLTAIRLEFERFTIAESQHRVGKGIVERELVLGTDTTAPETVADAAIGRPVDAVMALPEPLFGLFSGLVVESARLRGEGTAYGFGPPA